MRRTARPVAIFDAVSRLDGTYEFSKDLGLQNVVARIDPKTGKKLIKPALEPEPGRVDLICPASTGARSWPTTAIDPTTNTLYVPLLDNDCMDYSWDQRAAAEISAGGLDVHLGARPKPDNDGNFGRIDAIDLISGVPLISVPKVPVLRARKRGKKCQVDL